MSVYVPEVERIFSWGNENINFVQQTEFHLLSPGSEGWEIETTTQCRDTELYNRVKVSFHSLEQTHILASLCPSLDKSPKPDMHIQDEV